MRKLIFIFLIFFVHLFNCTNLPKLLKCIDQSCEDRISTGRVIKSTKPTRGTLEFLKSPSQVFIRGKNVDSQNTLWLVEQEGYYGFVDLSFIKELKNSVIEDLVIVKNPYDTEVDETEDSDDNTNKGGLFSNENTKSPVIPMENDETENFSEINSKLNVDKVQNTNNIKNLEVSDEFSNDNNENITISNLQKHDKLESKTENINNKNIKIIESSNSNKGVVDTVNIHHLKESSKEILNSNEDQNKKNKDSDSQDLKENKTTGNEGEKVADNIDSKEKIESQKVEEVKVDNEQKQQLKAKNVNKDKKSDEKENLHIMDQQLSDNYPKKTNEIVSNSSQNSEIKENKTTVTVDNGDKQINNIDFKEKVDNSKEQKQQSKVKNEKSDEKGNLHSMDQQNKEKDPKKSNEIVGNSSENSEVKANKTIVTDDDGMKLNNNNNNTDSRNIKEPEKLVEVKVDYVKNEVQQQPTEKNVIKDDKSDEKENISNIDQRNSDEDSKISHKKDSKIETNAKFTQDFPARDINVKIEPLEDSRKSIEHKKQIIETQKVEKQDKIKNTKVIHQNESQKSIEIVNMKLENPENTKTFDSYSSLKSEKQSESPPNNSTNENSEKQMPQKIQLKPIDNSGKLTTSSNPIKNVNNEQVSLKNTENIDSYNSLKSEKQSESPPNNSANENSEKQIPQKIDLSDNLKPKIQLKSIDNDDNQSDRLENAAKEESIQKRDMKTIPKEPIKTIENDIKYPTDHSKSGIQSPEYKSDKNSVIQSKEINKNKIDQSEMKPNETDNQSQSNQLPKEISTNEKEKLNTKSKIEISDKFQSNKLKREIKQKLDTKIPIKESIKGDPWLDNSGRQVQDTGNDINQIRSPIIKLIMKIDILSQLGIKYVASKLGFDSSSKLSQFTNHWLQMPLESFISVFLLFSILFLTVYAPKLLKFNRDWKSELIRQTELLKELEQKLQTTEEVRHKLTVQNHNFEKVIDEYKQQINEIQEDAAKNKKTVILEIEKIKKTNELNVKNLSNDLANKMQQCQLLENDLTNKINTIENLEENKRQMEMQFDDEKSQLEVVLLENKRELNRIGCLHDQLKHSHQLLDTENEELKARIQELNREIAHGNESYSQLEKSFEHLKVFEGLNFKEFNEKKSIYLDLTQTKEQLQTSERNVEHLSGNLQTKTELIEQLEREKIDMKQTVDRYENEKSLAITQKEAAEMKLQVLREYFQSKEMEMAKSLGHQVIETNQSMDQLDFLKHRIQNLESENEEMARTVQKLKSEIKESQTFATKCKTDANEEINRLFLKNMNLERSLQTEKDENKKLRTKLSHYCGPTPPRNQTSNYNHNNKDRPPSRQSGISEPVTTFVPLSFIPFTSPQSPIPNSNQFSGRNSVNSKKSNNT